MADIRKLAPLILKWEGKFADDPADAGGPTHMGITLRTLIKAGFDKNMDGLSDLADLKALNEQDVIYCFLKPFYWDRWQADHIQNQSIANLLVDWVWMSGKSGITIPQDVLGVKVDGIIGEKTLSAINNNTDQQMLFQNLKHERKSYIERICKARPANKKFQNGWLNRLADFRYSSFVLLFLICFSWGGCKSTAQLGLSASNSTETMRDSLFINQQEQISADSFREYTTEEIQEELVIIKTDSCPVLSGWLQNNSSGTAKGIVILKKKCIIKKNDYREKALATGTQVSTKQVIEKKQVAEVIKMPPKDLNLKTAYSICFCVLVLLIINKFTPLSRK
jgi:hypothetical protein